MRRPSDDPEGGGESAKARLRRRQRERLEALEASLRIELSKAAAERLLELPELAAARRTLCCLSFGVEVDTWRLIDRLLESGREVYVPRAELADRSLHWHAYPCELETLPFGLRQPLPGTAELTPEELAAIDVALIPGLAFDLEGYRLGHGGGFFDRFLAAASPLAVGLAFDSQIVDRLPHEPHDRPMGLVVTDRRTLRANPPS